MGELPIVCPVIAQYKRHSIQYFLRCWLMFILQYIWFYIPLIYIYISSYVPLNPISSPWKTGRRGRRGPESRAPQCSSSFRPASLAWKPAKPGLDWETCLAPGWSRKRRGWKDFSKTWEKCLIDFERHKTSFFFVASNKSEGTGGKRRWTLSQVWLHHHLSPW